MDYVEFPSETHPFDKFREGVHKVTTEFCALCADDDLIVPDGVERCLDALRSDPQASVAQGYSFAFLCRHTGDMDLGNILYFTSTIDDGTPLARVAKLFARYQAATYGNYRTPVLQRIFDTLKPMTSILGRELLGSALAAVEGHMIRVPCFSHGRSMDASESYEHWHPLEWFAKDSAGLFAEYHLYREQLAQAVLRRPDNTLDAAAVRRVIDIIHLRYMVKHAPDGALAFIGEQKLSGVAFEKYWPRPEIHLPLYEAACIGTSAAISPEAMSEKSLRSGGRTYNLHPNFFAPLGIVAPGREAVTDLLHCLEHYRLRPPVPVRPPSSAGAPAVRSRPVTVSVLLCNYNDARYLPHSLSAICTQTRLPEEVIVLDDGSTDNSLEIIESFAERHPFVRVLKNEKNRGLLYSINRALREARFDFVVWAAADDLLVPNFIARNIQCLERYPEAGMSFSRLAVFQDGSDEVTPFTGEKDGPAFDFGAEACFLSPEKLRERLERSYIWFSANTVMASRAALIQGGGFDQELRWHADHFGFMVVALRHGACCIPEILALMRQRSQTFSSAGMAKHKEQRATLGRFADKLTTKGWRDIAIATLRCPSLLSPFGGLMLEALLLKPRRWPFAVTYGLWWANHQWGRRGDISGRVGSCLARVALRTVLGILKRVNWLLRWVAHQVMRDLTLVIPTYNRPQLLAALLRYLETEKADCRVLVLDSSRPDVLAANRRRVAGCGLDAEFVEFPDLDPTDKWRRGIHKVTTPFCAFCADDDLVIVEGMRRCLDVLRSSPMSSVVQGYSFTFLQRPEGDIELNNIGSRPTVDDPSPLQRLDKLFQQYQAPSYGLFRTPTLRRILETLPSEMKILTRELLLSALAAIGGHLIRLPAFSYGRSIGSSGDSDCSHLLEWFCKDPDGLFAEYLRYRDILAAATMQRGDNEKQPDEIREMLDLIHLRYLARHAPDAVLEFIAEQQIAGVDFAGYWPPHESSAA